MSGRLFVRGEPVRTGWTNRIMWLFFRHQETVIMKSSGHMKKVNTVSPGHPYRLAAIACVLLAAAGLALSGCLAFPRRLPERPFTIVVLPDTQIYSHLHPDIFIQQARWIKEQKEARNIVCVVHEGDITNGGTEDEWKVADQAMSILDGVVPCCMVMGNHDYEGSAPAQRGSAQFNRHFGGQRFGKQSWSGGRFDDGNENAFYFIRAGGMKFMVLCLEFGPRDEVLEWADRVIAAHRRYRTIVVTHCYMYSDDTRVGRGDQWNPHEYGSNCNDGDEVWEKLVRKHRNIFLVLSGHILNSGRGRLSSMGSNGNKVDQILANYQTMENGGNGWLRIMEFRPEENKIIVSTYSPSISRYSTDPRDTFEIEYRMTGP